MRLTVKVGVDSILKVGPRSKVNELEVQGLEVDQEVLVLDVPVDDPFAMACEDRLHDLAEKVPCHLLLEHPLLSDEVKEVLAGGRLLHNIDEGVVALVKVEQPDHARDGLDLREQLELQRDSPSLELQRTNTESQPGAFTLPLLSAGPMTQLEKISYHVPIRDLSPGHVLDGDLPAIPDPDPGVDGSKTALAENFADFVGPLEGFAGVNPDG